MRFNQSRRFGCSSRAGVLGDFCANVNELLKRRNTTKAAREGGSILSVLIQSVSYVLSNRLVYL